LKTGSWTARSWSGTKEEERVRKMTGWIILGIIIVAGTLIYFDLKRQGLL